MPNQVWDVHYDKNNEPRNQFGELLRLCRRDCGVYTVMFGTGLCDACWELENRIRNNPELARQILKELGKETDEFNRRIDNWIKFNASNKT